MCSVSWCTVTPVTLPCDTVRTRPYLSTFSIIDLNTNSCQDCLFILPLYDSYGVIFRETVDGIHHGNITNNCRAYHNLTTRYILSNSLLRSSLCPPFPSPPSLPPSVQAPCRTTSLTQELFTRTHDHSHTKICHNIDGG